MPFAIAPTLKRRAIDANIMQNGEKATPQSRHSRRAAMFALSPKADIRLFGRECPLRAKSGHRPLHSIPSSARSRGRVDPPASAAQAGKRSSRVDICHGGVSAGTDEPQY